MTLKADKVIDSDTDAVLHDDLLASARGGVKSDLAAMRRYIKSNDGATIDEAARLFASPPTRKFLIRERLIVA